MTQPYRKNALYVRYFVVLILLLGGMITTAHPAEARPTALATVHDIYGVSNGDVWEGGAQQIHYIHNSITIPNGVTLTIQAGAVIKFYVSETITPLTLTVQQGGTLILQGTSGSQIYFSSGRDDYAGGFYHHTSGSDSNPASFEDWGGLILENSSADLNNLNVSYSNAGLEIKNKQASSVPALNPLIHNNFFTHNNCGLTLAVDNTGGIDSTVNNNTFEQNEYGLCTDQVQDSSASNETGFLHPTVNNNTFKKNHKLPILLEGAAFPVYGTGTSANTFIGYDQSNDLNNAPHLGIGLRGYIARDGEWPIVKGLNNTVDMPYVVTGTLTINANFTVKVNAYTVFKFYTYNTLDPEIGPGDPFPTPKIIANGTLALPTAPPDYVPSPTNRLVVFTSYHDDSVAGDTDNDAGVHLPKAGDWDSVDFFDKRATGTGTDEFIFEYMDFRYGINGLLYETSTSGSVRKPEFRHLEFLGNVNGLRIKADGSHVTTASVEPKIIDCTFTDNGRVPEIKTQDEWGVPIFFENTVIPTYQSNTFNQTHNKAIGVAGTWTRSTTWGPVDVKGVGSVQLPFVVHGAVSIGTAVTDGIDNGVILTIPSGAVIKFNVNKLNTGYRSSITAYGKLNLLSDTTTSPIAFTSIFDDYGGDFTDGPDTASITDWDDVDSRYPSSTFVNIIVRYSKFGLHLHNMGAYDLNSPVQHSVFDHNTYGLQLHVEKSGDIISLIEYNDFLANTYGLVTDALSSSSRGISQPTLRGNTFEYNTVFPIYLKGSASPVYATDPANTFRSNTIRAIGLAGYFGSDDDDIYLPQVPGDTDSGLPNFIFPYVVDADTKFDWQTRTHISGGLLFKAKQGVELNFLGILDMTTSAGNRNYFTAYPDDWNNYNTDNAAEPASISRTYWSGVYISNPQTASFSYSTITYAANGLWINQETANPLPGNLSPNITGNTFQENNFSLYLQIQSSWDIKPNVVSNLFQDSNYGLRTEVVDVSGAPYTGTANPVLKQNQFYRHAQFPIWLDGSSDPQYGVGSDKNVFNGNAHPAIAVSGYWCREATWTLVEGDVVPGNSSTLFPYVVVDNIFVELLSFQPVSALIHIPANSLIKTVDDRSIHVYGQLDFQGSPGNEITFTSYKDDGIYHGMGGNTDQTTTKPAQNEWKYVVFYELSNKYHNVHDVLVKYASSGMVFVYAWDNGDVYPTVDRAVYDNCTSGILLVVGWRKDDTTGKTVGAKGSIRATLTDVDFQYSSYGLLTITHNLAIGIARPKLINVTFKEISGYPMFFAGTTEPDFASGNQIVMATQPGAEASGMSVDPEAAPAPELPLDLLSGLPLPEDGLTAEPAPAVAAAPGAELAAVLPQGLSTAVALGGPWNNAIALPPLPIPYVVFGTFPITDIRLDNIPYPWKPDMTIGEAKPDDLPYATVALPAGAVVKFNTGRALNILPAGNLVLQSNLSEPIVFTSFMDDSLGGDTNRNGALNHPATGDWVGIIHASQNKASEFHDAIVRFATEGLHVTADYASILPEPNHISVYNNIFLDNTTGLVLEALRYGNLDATVDTNLFFYNGTHILGKPNNGYSGKLYVHAHNNDLLGDTSQTGVVNQNLNTKPATDLTCEFDATNNYWGDPSGPYHLTLNPNGQGSTVSDLVRFSPIKATPAYPSNDYTLSGRITDKVTGLSVGGVQLTLIPLGLTTNSLASGGLYSFQNVPAGSYTLVPSKEGYEFNPPQMYLTIETDASGLDFIATDVSLSGNRKVSVASTTVFWSGSSDVTVYIPVSLDQPNTNPENIVVYYTIVDGSAVGGKNCTACTFDYTYSSQTGSLTFSKTTHEQVKKIPIVIKKGTGPRPPKYFTIQLSLPTTGSGSVQIAANPGIITIMEPSKTYLPLVRR